MGAWSTSITGNDTAQDLRSEYTAAFYKYDVTEALARIDAYVRTNMFDESDPEEWCNYMYSLADFMWKKGILTESVRQQVIAMIEGDFGLELWAEAGQKTLDSRKKKLAEFQEKLLSPQPPKKKIKPNVYTERIFRDGDIVAVQLQTKGKPYTEGDMRPMTKEEFFAVDGKYVLMQLVRCRTDWSSSIVPEVKDHWAEFRLFDGIFDAVPENIDFSRLKEANLWHRKFTPFFFCESSMFYFKRRKYKVLCNRKDLIEKYKDMPQPDKAIFWGINKPWINPDSELVAAMGVQITCGVYTGTPENVRHICQHANRFGRYDYSMTAEENEAKYIEEEKRIAENIDAALSGGGVLYGISCGREFGIVTVDKGRVDNLYIEGEYQRNGFGTRLLAFTFSAVGHEAYIDVPREKESLIHVCEKIGLKKIAEDANCIRMTKP